MAVDQTANFVRGSVSSSVGGSDTTIDVSDASIYPDPSNGQYNIVIWDFDEYQRPDLDPDVEVIRVTGRDTSNNNLTVTRGEEGTASVSHPSTAELHLSPTSKVFTDIDSKITSSLSITGSNGLNGGSAELGGSIDISINGTLSLDSDLQAADGETIWDESATYIPQGRLENDSMTIAGNSVSLGSSTAINHTNLSNISSDDHHAKYTDSEARSAVSGSDLSLNTLEVATNSKQTTEDILLNANSNISTSGSSQYNLLSDSTGEFQFGFGDTIRSGDETYSVKITDSTLNTIGGATLQEQGNRVATRTWATGNNIDHSDLGTTSSDDHHTRYADEEAQDAVGGILNSDFTYNDSGNTISLSSNSLTVAGNSVSLGGSTSVNHSDLSNISSDDHHSKYTDGEAVSAVESAGDITFSGSITGGSNGYVFIDSGVDPDSPFTDQHGNPISFRNIQGSTHQEVFLGDVDADNGNTIFGIAQESNSILDLKADSTLTLSGNTVSPDNVSDAHHSKYTDENAQDAVGTIMSGGTDLSVSYDDSDNSISISHNNTSSQGNVSTGGATVIDDIDLDGRGHVTNMNTQNRSLDDWGDANADIGMGGNNIDSIKSLKGSFANISFEGSTFNIDLSDNSADGRYRDSDNNSIIWFRHGGDVDIPNGDLNMESNAVTTDNFEVTENSATNSLDFNYTGG